MDQHPVRLRKLGADAALDAANLDFGLLCRDARRQSRQRAIAVERPTREPGVLTRVRQGHDRVQRAPEIDVGRREVKAGGHDADDRVRLMAHDELFAEHVAGTTESFPPQPVADGDDRCTLLLRTRHAAEQRRCAEHVIERTRRLNGASLVVAIIPGDVEAIEAVARNAGDCLRLPLPIAEIRQRRRIAVGRVTDGPSPDRDQPFGLAVGERAKEHRVDDAKGGGVGADA